MTHFRVVVHAGLGEHRAVLKLDLRSGGQLEMITSLDFPEERLEHGPYPRVYLPDL